MGADKPKRRSAIYCPQCGHMEVKVPRRERRV